MGKIKQPLILKMFHWITSHPWLKLISLILAILVWFYVRGEINRFN